MAYTCLTFNPWTTKEQRTYKLYYYYDVNCVLKNEIVCLPAGLVPKEISQNTQNVLNQLVGEYKWSGINLPASLVPKENTQNVLNQLVGEYKWSGINLPASLVPKEIIIARTYWINCWGNISEVASVYQLVWSQKRLPRNYWINWWENIGDIKK